MTTVQPSSQVHSTAGAVPIKNEKGQMYMLKVKVQRYVAGKKPDFASSSSSDSDNEQNARQVEEIKAFSSRPSVTKGRGKNEDDDGEGQLTAADLQDPRFRRLVRAKVTFCCVHYILKKVKHLLLMTHPGDRCSILRSYNQAFRWMV
ncbi:unnamed protein product [Dicrocoelium dendriticum]|nr:unnamed protein product [Dicrocoelium dendriticum]